jgi:hypothetical protein
VDAVSFDLSIHYFIYKSIAMKFLNISLTTLMLRYYLMMAVVIVAFFAGIPWLAFLALPIFLSALLGIEFKHSPTANRAHQEVKSGLHTRTQPSH